MSFGMGSFLLLSFSALLRFRLVCLLLASLPYLLLLLRGSLGKKAIGQY